MEAFLRSRLRKGLIGIWGLGATKFRPEPQKYGFFRASSYSAVRRPGTWSKCECSVLFHFPVSRRKRGSGSMSVQSWNTPSDDANCTKVITLGYTEWPKIDRVLLSATIHLRLTYACLPVCAVLKGTVAAFPLMDCVEFDILNLSRLFARS